LCQHLNIKPGSPEQKRIRGEFADGMAVEFGERYGNRMDDLRAWQKLCEAVGVDDVPTKVRDCQEIIYAIDVNLVELTGGSWDGTDRTPSKVEVSSDKIFPLGSTKAGAILSSILAVQMGGDPSAFIVTAKSRKLTLDSQLENSDAQLAAALNAVELNSEGPSTWEQADVPLAEDSDRELAAALSAIADVDTSPTDVTEQPGPEGPMYAFFGQFAAQGFEHQLESPPTSEFIRLCRHLRLPFGRGVLDPTQKALYDEFAEALWGQFEFLFGQDPDDVVGWVKLCDRIGIYPNTLDLDEIRKAVLSAHVNAIDVVDVMGVAHGQVRVFKTSKERMAYTQRFRPRKVFPRGKAERQGTMLMFLLTSKD
jgi:hypothetical protein